MRLRKPLTEEINALRRILESDRRKDFEAKAAELRQKAAMLGSMAPRFMGSIFTDFEHGARGNLDPDLERYYPGWSAEDFRSRLEELRGELEKLRS